MSTSLESSDLMKDLVGYKRKNFRWEICNTILMQKKMEDNTSTQREYHGIYFPSKTQADRIAYPETKARNESLFELFERKAETQIMRAIRGRASTSGSRS